MSHKDADEHPNSFSARFKETVRYHDICIYTGIKTEWVNTIYKVITFIHEHLEFQRVCMICKYDCATEHKAIMNSDAPRRILERYLR